MISTLRRTGLLLSVPLCVLLAWHGWHSVADRIEKHPATHSPSSSPSEGIAGDQAGEIPADAGLHTAVEEIPEVFIADLAHFRTTHDFTALDRLLDEHPEGSRLKPLLEAEVAEELYSAGLYSDSLVHFKSAWASALASAPKGWKEHKLVARIGCRLGGLYARLGRMEELRSLLAELSGRPIEGAETLAFESLRQALAGMENFPEHSFKCGPLALGRVFSRCHPQMQEPAAIAEIGSPRSGFSLAEVVRLGRDIDFPVAAVRPTGGTIPVPSVVHWRSEHYAAITETNEGRYLVEDPTFQRSVWMTPEAIARESSGFFVVPQDRVEPGWIAANETDASSTFGKGAPSQSETDTQGGDENVGESCGLPRAGFNDFYAALVIRDTPLFYTPPVGPAVAAELTYFDASNYDNATAAHGHPGKKWLLSWIRHIEVPQLNAAGATLRTVNADGKTEKYQGTVSGETLAVANPGLHSLSRLVVAGGTGGNPIASVTKSLPDGSSETYGYIEAAGNPQAFGAVVGGGLQNSKLYLAEFADPQGNRIRFRYAPGTAKLKGVVDAIGQETTIHYSDAPDGLGADNSARRLISAIRDPFGRVARFLYDAQERLTSITDVAGIQASFAYTSSGFPDFITGMTTPYGTSAFAKNGSTLTLTDPEGLQEKVSFAYSRRDIPLAGVTGTVALPAETPNTPGVTIANGQSYYGHLYYGTTLYWDKKTMRMFGDRSDKAHQTRWAQQTTSYTLLTGVPLSRRPAMAHREWYLYPGQPNPGTIGTTSQPSLRIRRIKDENGDPADEIHRYEYNAAGFPTRTIDPLGREMEIQYALNGIDVTAIRRKRGAGFETLASFSGYGQDSPYRPRYSTDAAGQTTEFRWNPRGQLTETINPLGQRSVNTYNANGYLTKIEHSNPAAPASLVTLATFTYDALGRVSRATSSDGYFVDLEYDALNRPLKTTYPDGTWESVTYQALSVASTRDRLGRVTSHTYNGNMQRVSTTDPANRMLKFEWCSCGALQVLIDAMNRPTRWHYDIMGRQVAKEYADGSTDRYRYDPASGRLEAVIDAKGNVKTRRYHLDGQLAALRYNNDPETPDVTFTYDPADGRIAGMTDGIGNTAYSYHPTSPGTPGAGQLAAVDGPWANDVISYAYDALGRVSTRAIDGVPQTQAFDALGRTGSITNPLGTFTYAYDGATSRVVSATHGGGVRTEYSYFPAAQDFRLQRIRNLKPDGMTPVSVFDYTHDAIGRILTWKQQEDNAVATAKTWTFGYDNADQLTSALVTQGAATVNNYGWTYDPAANRLTETAGAATTTFNYNALNELHETTAALPETTYEWDAEDRLIAINKGTSRSEFTYDGMGRRVRIVENQNGLEISSHTYLWEGLAIRERRAASDGTVQQRYYAQGFAGLSGGPVGVHLYTGDHLGSIREVVNPSGTVLERIGYGAWGKPTFSNTTPLASFAYTGHLWHQGSGLQLALYRAYSASLGRWVSKDPAGESEGPNLYAYVSNAPLMYSDPLGLAEMSSCYVDVQIDASDFVGHTQMSGQCEGSDPFSFSFGPTETVGLTSPNAPGTTDFPTHDTLTYSAMFNLNKENYDNISNAASAMSEDKYNLYLNNCTTTVVDLLAIGGIRIPSNSPARPAVLQFEFERGNCIQDGKPGCGIGGRIPSSK
jgi:RHS repeat-associated protein